MTPTKKRNQKKRKAMKTENAMKKLAKYGEVKTDGRGKFWVTIGLYNVGFQDQLGDIVCPSLWPVRDNSNVVEDYSEKRYPNSLTQAIRLASR